MSLKPKKCPACERGVLESRPSREAMPYRHSPAVVPAWPVDVPTCTACDEKFIDAKTAKAWDAALEEGLALHQRALLLQAVGRLGDVRQQSEWEKRLGLSPGYLSRLKAGKECSAPLTTLLALLSEAPADAWEHVGRIWSADSSPVVAPVVRLVHSVRFDAELEAANPRVPNVSAQLTSVAEFSTTGGTLPEAA